MIEKNTTGYFLGFLPTSFEDIIEYKVNWGRAFDMDADYRIPNSLDVNQTSVIIMINFDYTEKIFTIKYTGVLDIMQRIGGLQASIMPIMRFANPWLYLVFLIALCRIIREKAQDMYKNEILTFLKLTEA